MMELHMRIAGGIRGGYPRLGRAVAGILFCASLCACSGQMRPSSPINARQRAELDKLAASETSPAGLKDALAAIDANEKRRGCQDQTAAVAQRMKMLGMVDAVAWNAGNAAGPGGTKAAKMIAVMHAKSIRAQVSQLQPCADPA